nr:hypothetical protein [Tanacetum cinerariifolium]
SIELANVAEALEDADWVSAMQDESVRVVDIEILLLGQKLQTQPTSQRFVVPTNSSHHSGTNVADDEVTYVVRLSMPPPYLLTAAVTTTVIADVTSIPALGAGTRMVPHNIFGDSASTSWPTRTL